MKVNDVENTTSYKILTGVLRCRWQTDAQFDTICPRPGRWWGHKKQNSISYTQIHQSAPINSFKVLFNNKFDKRYS